RPLVGTRGGAHDRTTGVPRAESGLWRRLGGRLDDLAALAHRELEPGTARQLASSVRTRRGSAYGNTGPLRRQPVLPRPTGRARGRRRTRRAARSPPRPARGSRRRAAGVREAAAAGGGRGGPYLLDGAVAWPSRRRGGRRAVRVGESRTRPRRSNI